MKNKKTLSTQRLTTLKVGTDNQFKESTDFRVYYRIIDIKPFSVIIFGECTKSAPY